MLLSGLTRLEERLQALNEIPLLKEAERIRDILQPYEQAFEQIALVTAADRAEDDRRTPRETGT